MKKVIPLAMAIIVVLAVGSYFMTAKYPKNTGVRETQTQTTKDSQSSAIAPATVTTPVSVKVNQISLSITAPTDGSTVTTPTITVSGTTVAGAQVAVNDKDILAGSNGNFATTLILEEGDNYIDVVANDADGNVAEQELMVAYEPVIQ